MAVLNVNHIIGPFSRPIKYRSIGAGYYIFPHNDAEPAGWGKPYTLLGGAPVPEPGTPVSGGGYDPYRRYAYNADTARWVAGKFPGNWLYGNIDWRGPVENPSTDPDFRIKLSYHGPQTRYFASDGFAYGSAAEHNEIYCKGRYAGVAPRPVLGAAYYTYTDPNTLQETEYLVAICKDGLFDVVYIRAKLDLLSPPLSSQTREWLMRTFDPATAPTGWREILRVSRQNTDNEVAQAARTPWFFSENGAQAQCMREMKKTFNNGLSSVEEEGLNRYKIVITSPNKATFLNTRNVSGFEYSCLTLKESEPHGVATQTDMTQDSVTAFVTCPREQASYPRDVRHFYSIDHIDQELNMTGTYAVAVDYAGNQEIVVKVKYAMWRTFRKWWRYNIDTAVAANVYSNVYNNTNYQDHPADDTRWSLYSWFDAGGDYVRSLVCAICQDAACDANDYIANGGTVPPQGPSDGYGDLWGGLEDKIKLIWTHPTGGAKEILLYQVSQGARPGWNPAVSSNYQNLIIYLRNIYSVFPYYLDVRPPAGPVFAAMAEAIEKNQESDANPLTYLDVNNREYKQILYFDPFSGMTDVEVIYEDKGDEYFTNDNDEMGSRAVMVAWDPAGALTSPNEPTTGAYVRKDFDWAYNTITIDGHYVTKPEYTAQTLEPHPDDWLGEAWGDTPWPTWKSLLCGAKNQTEGGWQFQDGESVCMSFSYASSSIITAPVPGEPAIRRHNPKPVTESQYVIRPPGSPPLVADVYYFNHVTGADLDNAVPPADRFYPIGVE